MQSTIISFSQIMLLCLTCISTIHGLNAGNIAFTLEGEGAYDKTLNELGIQPKEMKFTNTRLFKGLDTAPALLIDIDAYNAFHSFPKAAFRTAKQVICKTLKGGLYGCAIGIGGGAIVGLTTNSWIAGAPAMFIGGFYCVYPGAIVGLLYGSYKSLFDYELTTLAAQIPEDWKRSINEGKSVAVYSTKLNKRLAQLGTDTVYQKIMQ